MLSLADACASALADVRPLPTERVALLDALGRVLGEDVAAPLMLPPWDNSAMDGYAVRAADIESASAAAPVTLAVLETIAAGAFPSLAVESGAAIRIMTGAPVPAGADSVVRVEDTDGGIERVMIRSARDARKNIRPCGEDFASGAIALPSGSTIGAAQIAVLASVGAAEIAVHRRPRVAYLSSGDELVELDRFNEVLAGRRIVSSNSYALHAMIRAAGGEPVSLGLARDDPADLRDRIARAAGCDVLVTTGGISLGAFDYTRDALAELGAALKFWKVRIRPGAQIGVGTVHGMMWIGVPGNPVSTMIAFELIVRPVLLRMLGHTRVFRRPVSVVLEEPVTITAGLTHFLRAIVTVHHDGDMSARLTGPQGSGLVSSMSRANALLVVPEDRPRCEAGERLHALLLNDDAQLSAFFAL